MSSGNPKVGPKLKVKVPNFKRTDFSGDIERLGGLSARGASNASKLQRCDIESEKSLLPARQKATTAGAVSSSGKGAATSPTAAAAANVASLTAQETNFAPSAASTSPVFDEWLQSISRKPQELRATGAPARHGGTSPRRKDVFTADKSDRVFADYPEDDLEAVASFDGVPLETFDSAEDFEINEPEEWLQLCQATPGRPQACVLHYVSHEWTMLPCWVIGYEPTVKRYQVELEDGGRKHVKRLALRFNAEDPVNFARRVETCRAKKVHCELQQAFINFIESQDDNLVSPMLREHKERFIKQCLNKRCQIEEACNYVGTIRELILEIERSYMLSMKFAKVKGDLIEGNGTPEANVCEGSPFAPLLSFFLPRPVPHLALVHHEMAEFPVCAIVDHLDKQPTLHANIWNVTYAVWRRFGEEVSRHRILDIARRSQSDQRSPLRTSMAQSFSADRVFDPNEFITHMEEHRQDITVTLSRHWRDFIVSEVLDKMSEASNFFVDNATKHLRSPLHRVLYKLDLILNTQMRWFVENSINDWVAFVQSFEPKPSQSLPPPLLTLSLAAADGEVVLVPDPDVLISRIMELIDGVTEVAKAINVIEFELVPFCSLPQKIMFEVSTDDPLLKEARRATEEVIRNCLRGPQEVQFMYQQYAYLLMEEVQDLDALDVEGVRDRTAAYMQARFEIETLSASVVKSPFFELHCADIIETLSDRALYLANVCLSAVATSVDHRSAAVLTEWDETHTRILSNPEDEEELAKLKQFMADINQLKTKPLMATTKHIHQQIDMLSDFSFEINHEVVERAFKAFRHPLQVQIDVADSERSLDTQKQKFMDKLDQEKAEFERDVSRYQEDLDWVRSLNDYSMANKCATKIYTLKENLDRAKERVQSFVEREKLFNIEMSDYSELDSMNEGFEPYFKLWTAAIEFKHSEEEWLNGALSKLNKEDIDQIVEEQFKESYKMWKLFDGHDNPQTVAKDLREDIGAFRANMPIIQAICQEAFQPMHFIMLFDELDTDMDMEDGLTLQQLLEIGILEHIDTVERISGEAQKQYALKTALAMMKKEWKPMELVTIEYKETGTSIVKGIDDIQALLDDHIVKTQGIRGSPFVKPIEKEVKDWEAKLLYIQDLLEQWLNCQRAWLYLEPIFSSDDIQKQMPTEAKRFGQVNALWRTTMDAVVDNPNVLDVSDIENLLANFTDANKKLDLIQKGLNDYLETKRLAFPRFFFLSNDELLMILSQTKDPTAVQPHMNKCFEGVNRVRFDDKNEIIEGMFSVEGEVVDLTSPVNVIEGDKNGNVEKWLMEVQDSMINCLTVITGESVKAYASTQRTKWVLEWPAQSIIAVDNIYWTKEVAAAIDNGRLDDYHKQCVAQLSGLVNLVRGDLTKLGRQTLSAVVTIDVHNRDVVKDLVNAKISSPKEFDWMAQLRYYWCYKGSVILKETDKPNDTDKMQVAIINAVLYYGFEYLGNSDRLVITPLTDRCYRTLMGAFHLYYGGAPEGPAGTGKTESTKDLAKACAVQCVVFNCSDGLDYIAMGKFFKGLASSGAWCCFDEFNRINLEVLSVISQQVATIQKAVREKKKVFIFEGTEIQLVPSCAVNITMNPGYAGRSELPDNLKALFRPCAMMVPDYALIGEIVLYSNGFEDAKNLARKAVGSLRLSSEQLSSQDHYDFGMRALKSILVRAGALRRMYGNTRSEAVLALSALNDVNVPKFTSNDIPLFLGITGDLFPGVELPPSDYGALIDELEGSARSLGLQPKKEFIHKCLQLWETIMVRHGLMLVGMTVSGKTEVENVLAAALASVADGGNYLPVQMYKMNPKSIKQGQLYGDFDDNTHEWSDGILALTVRAAASAEPTKWQWVLLDGPVDAVWIENMNTVLDDNKKLCLNSGEIIKLSLVTRMMFEVEDLTAASPATVSRCGMVFLEQVDIGWQVLMQSWLDRLPERVAESAGMMKDMMESVIDCCWEMLQRKVKQPVPVNCNSIVASLLKLYTALIRLDLPLDSNLKDLSPKEKELKLDALFWHALIWSFGCVTDEDGRKVMNTFIRTIMVGQPVKEDYKLICDEPSVKFITKVAFPEDGTVFDYFFHSSNKWELWTKRITSFDIPKDAQMHTIIVPTADTVRNAFLLQTLIRSEYHVLMSGLTGTGKTVVIQQELLNNFDREKYTNMAFAFSAQTTANQTQDIIDGKLDKRRKGTYGPPLGKRCLVFVDDLNMPAKEVYGAQPPIELLRQWMDTGGWYERKTCEFRSLVDLNFIGAMGPPGAGRPQLTARYQRHYNLIFVTPFENESLVRIFSSVMAWFLSRFPSAVSGLGQAVVKASIEIYDSISSGMRPTPLKSHYTFNLRDLSKVHQGICLCSKPSLPGPDDLVKCWAHECQRVFQDRLINKEDQTWFGDLLKRVMETHFKKQWKGVVKVEPLVWGDFVNSKQPYYQEVLDHTDLTGVLDSFLMDYNSLAKRGMELVLFLAAVEHICRIVRILKIPLGNALLVGVGGSGRRSMATLATFVAEYETFQIEISKNYSTADWCEDIKRLLMRVGANAKEVTFLLADTQIPKESFLEDTSSLLNNGEVPNLFNAEDKTQILEACTAPAAQLGRTAQADIFAFFNEQCRRNLHIVLALSPIGAAFRRRVRMFPSLVNCCTIDWFMEWPDEALRGVADHFLHKVDLNEDVFRGVVEICVEMQKSVFGLASRFFQEVQRYYYVTPTSYLELINSFKDVLQAKRSEVLNMKGRYDEGLEKLITTEEQVSVMSKELEELRPVLKQTSAETQELMVNIEQKQKEAKATQAIVSKEEDACSQQAEEARVMKEECQADLDQAIPALNSALDALKNLKKEHLVEVKNLKTPPDGVVVVSKAMCWCFDVKAKKVTAPDGRTKVDDFWEPAKKAIWSDAKLIDRMLNFDKDNIPDDVIQKLKPLEDDPSFEPETIKKASVAAFGICKWVRAMIVYDGVAKVVQPKREQLQTAETQLSVVMAELSKKKAELKAVQDNVAKLLSEFETAKKKKDDLEIQVDDCSKRLVRAEKLINGLGGEKTRWAESSEKLGQRYNNITGDVLISSGIVAYLGAFMGKYRQSTCGSWISLMREHKVPASDEFSLRSVLGDDVVIRQWVIDKLPNDQVSIENALILSKSRRWPLMIDPQLQANQWIRKSNSDKKLRIIRLSQQGYARILENAISYGEPVLLENVAEALDPLLDPLLQKAKFKAGNMIMIRLGDSTIEYSEEFRLYITTKLPNPHYPPEICVQVTLLNFMATPDGLEDQMLGILVAKEEPDTEKRRQALILDSAASKAQLKEIEDRILELLSSAKGNILDDEELINTLATSKVASQRIEERVAEQEKISAQVQEIRELYVPLAIRASALFFVISELCVVEPMYQYSLEWFISIYLLSIATAEKFDGRNVQKRLLALQKQFVRLLYEKVCDSLFEKDKLMFSLLLAFKSMEVDNELNQEEKMLLLLGGVGTGADIEKPEAEWLTNAAWQRVCVLGKLGKGPWSNFATNFKQKIDAWQTVFDADSPLDAPWPSGVKEHMTPLQRSLVLLAVRTDCTVTGLQEVIASKLGKEFLEPPSFNLEKSFNDSTACMPLIFVLSSGADPMAEVARLGVKLGMNERQTAVSLGQGQGKKAEEAVKDGLENGFWVLLQNCHLAPSWMPTLEVIVEELTPDKVDAQFRLWLTAMPSPEFPVSVLQNGFKMTNEPPKGLKSNLLRAYLSFEPDWFDEACRKTEACQHAFRKMLFGLCFFHALIQERCNYGPLGWNIPYQFSEPDRQICVSQLHMFLEENDNIPYEALRYTAAEANYGGRVTDTHDRRCIAFILTDFYCPEILNDNYRFSPSGKYFAPAFCDLDGYVDYIRDLPINQMPEAFGLHANANLVAAIGEAMRNLQTACSMQPKSGGSGSGRSSDEILSETSAKFLTDLPGLFDTEAINAKYPVEYKESMNTVLRQELLRFNKLLSKVRSTLIDIGKAVKGLVVMSPELDDVATGILQNTIPSVWKKVSYPSLKPTSSYVADLAARLKFLTDWVDEGIPVCFWVSGFYFTQSFLTGQLQNFARKFTLPIDTLIWTFKVLKRAEKDFDKPQTGCFIYGLFIDGARWDDAEGVIAESYPKVLFDSIPHIHIVPCEQSKDPTDRKSVYMSPVYKTSERKGTLSTTGHSTNFVMPMLIPIAKQHNEKYWAKRGVACLTQLDD